MKVLVGRRIPFAASFAFEGAAIPAAQLWNSVQLDHQI